MEHLALGVLLVCSIGFTSFAAGIASNRIAGGAQAAPKQFPYHVGLRLIPENIKVPFCGGALISDIHILTAAQCAKGAEAIDVILGDIHRTENDDVHRKTIRVGQENIIVHWGYDEIELIHDIALIKLPAPVEFNDYISPVPLPRNDENEYEGVTATALGWGYSKNDGHLSEVLRYVKFQVIANYYCAIYSKGSVLPSNVCADFYRNKTICTGDTGGPLVWDIDNRRTLIGVASYGTPDCEPDVPSVFTRTTSYLRWIKENTEIGN